MTAAPGTIAALLHFFCKGAGHDDISQGVRARFAGGEFVVPVARRKDSNGWELPTGSGSLPGRPVRWNWGAHTAEGKIAERFTKDVTRTIKGERIKRKASPEEPAYLIVQDDGSRVLKSQSELERR